MFKKRLLLLIVAIITATLLTGCMNNADQNVRDSKSMLDVVTKAQQTMSKQNGYTADVHSSYQIDMSNLGAQEVSTDLSITATNQPKAFHSIGTSKAAGLDGKTETYYADGIIYQKTGDRWFKMSSGLLNSILSQNQQLEDSLKQFQLLVEAYQGVDKTDEITMTQTKNGEYQIKIDIQSAKGSEVLKKKVQEVLQSAMKANPTPQASTMQNMMNNFLIDSYKAIMLIDSKTFELKKISIDSKMVMKDNGMNMAMKQSHIYTFKGPFSGKIEVPENVKANATELSNQPILEEQQPKMKF